jgi:hypothetical protein
MLRKVYIEICVRNKGLTKVKNNEVYMNCKKGSVVEKIMEENTDKKAQCL